jgi:hypothetical protein
MMAVLELYGKCKELGYCDCGGFRGCHDPKPPAPKPVIENELANAMKAEHEVSDYHNHNYRRELEAIEQSEGGSSNAKSATGATYRTTRISLTSRAIRPSMTTNRCSARRTRLFRCRRLTTNCLSG